MYSSAAASAAAREWPPHSKKLNLLVVIVPISFHLVNVNNAPVIVTLIMTVLEICYVFNVMVVKMSQDVLGV